MSNILKKTTKNYCTHGKRRLHYQTYGRGSEVILAFHGYGQDHQVFYEAEKLLGGQYTIYSFDLFFHGESSWLSRHQTLSIDEWCTIVKNFLRTQRITRFSVMGYSMGGRFALSLIGCFAKHINQLILIAPDGIRSSPWYQLASTTLFGNYLLRTIVNRPFLFFNIVMLARYGKFINRGVLKFAVEQMDTRRKRYAVYCRWTVLRAIKPNLSTVVRECNRQSINVKIYLGQYDQIVKKTSVERLHRKLIFSKLYNLSVGHNKIVREAIIHLSNRS